MRQLRLVFSHNGTAEDFSCIGMTTWEDIDAEAESSVHEGVKDALSRAHGVMAFQGVDGHPNAVLYVPVTKTNWARIETRVAEAADAEAR